MRTFIFAIILSIESQYNFINLSKSTNGFEQVGIAVLIALGVLMLVAQDVKEIIKK